MKRKKAGRKTREKRAGRAGTERVSAMLERKLVDVLRDRPAAPGDEFWKCPDDGVVDGISLPADLDAAAFLAATAHFVGAMAIELGSPDGEDKRRWALYDSLGVAYRAGFAMAVRVYAADLKNVPRVASIRDALARGRRIGAETNRRKAEPTRKAIRKQFRELRKQGFSKKDARNDLAVEHGKSFRQIERDTKRLS